MHLCNNCVLKCPPDSFWLQPPICLGLWLFPSPTRLGPARRMAGARPWEVPPRRLRLFPGRRHPGAGAGVAGERARAAAGPRGPAARSPLPPLPAAAVRLKARGMRSALRQLSCFRVVAHVPAAATLQGAALQSQ